MARSKSEEAEKKSEHVDQRECPGGGSDDHCMLAHEQHIGDHSDQQQATTTGKATVTVRHTCACCLRCEMFRGVRSSGSGSLYRTCDGDGRNKYAAKRLREQLERKRKTDEKSVKDDGNNNERVSTSPVDVLELPPIDDQIAFIEGEEVASLHRITNKRSARATKRARQKQKQHPPTPDSADEHAEQDDEETGNDEENKSSAVAAEVDSDNCACAGTSRSLRELQLSDVLVPRHDVGDNVIAPRLLEQLDAVDHDVEKFKQMLHSLDRHPRAERPKVAHMGV